MARLPVYLRALGALADEGVSTVSSEELAAAAGVNSAKLRKDLSYLGSYGTRGVGYDVEYLVYQVSRELGLTQDWPVVIVGLGNLGHALANYGGFASRGFAIRRWSTPTPPSSGTEIAGLTVAPLADLERLVRDHGVAIGVIATPAAVAQERLRPAGRRRREQHPQLRAGRARRPGRGRGAQGRHVHRAADPRLPRAAQAARASRSRPASSARAMNP